MASDDENDGGRGQGLQYPLPLVGSREQSEFIDVLRLLEEGKLEPEQALKRLMAFYQMGMGAWIRALGEIKPEMASEMVEKLTKDMHLISGHYGAQSKTPGASISTAGNVRLTNKTLDTLCRERVILQALIKSNRNLSSSELRKLIEMVEPDVKMATITANLDRLWKLQQIDRPRKGHYASTENSSAYLTALESEIEARGQNLPPIDVNVD